MLFTHELEYSMNIENELSEAREHSVKHNGESKY